MIEQKYEEYWSLTLEYTDFDDDRFLTTLEMTIEKIDELHSRGVHEYNKNDYANLQNEILEKLPKSSSDIENQLASTRKAINQCVKLGFVNSFLESYHPLAKEYLSAKTDRKRRTLFSRIVYDNASFNRSVTHESDLQQLNFLIDTLVENGELSKNEIIALMTVDIANAERGFLEKSEIESYLAKAVESGFVKRKYNQISYLNNILNKLDGIVFVDDKLYFTEDAKKIFGEELEAPARKRNPYLHLLYKNQLKEESLAVFGKEECMVEKLAYPVLIASHIKPFIKCSDSEAYDVNNGILLSRNVDALFDLGYITFDDQGKIVFAESLDDEVKKSLSKYRLDEIFLNSERIRHLEYHREHVFRGQVPTRCAITRTQ